MKLNTEILSDVDEFDWDNQLKRQDYATASQVANYSKPAMQTRHCKAVYIKISNTNGNILGQLSALIDFSDPRQKINRFSKIMINKLKLGTKIMWDHGPIIHDYKNQKQITELILIALEQLADQYNVEIIRGSSNPMNSEISKDVFKNLGYDCKLWSTYIINCNQDSNSFYHLLDKKTRYDLRKAKENELVFDIAKQRSEYDEFGRLKSKLRGIEPPEKYSENERDYAWNILYKSGIRKLFLMRHKDELIGGIDSLSFNDNIIQTSVINTKNQLKGGIFLTWNAIKWAIENKCKTFDFGGANPNPITTKEKNIDFYKARWKGKKYDQFIFLKVRKPIKKKISSVVIKPSLISSKFKSFVGK